MADKEFKSIDEQIAILRSRGLQINDETAAVEFLRLKDEMRCLSEQIPFVSLAYYGFPSQWQNLI